MASEKQERDIIRVLRDSAVHLEESGWGILAEQASRLADTLDEGITERRNYSSMYNSTFGRDWFDK